MEDSLNLERNINRKSELNLISCLKFKCHIFQKVVFLKIAFFFSEEQLVQDGIMYKQTEKSCNTRHL